MTETKIRPARFLMAMPVKNLEATKLFYKEVLGCGIEKSTEDSVEFSFYGNIIRARLYSSATGVDLMGQATDKEEPLYHFGAVLDKFSWQALHDKLEAAGIEFLWPPSVEDSGKPSEHGSMFIEDPSGNFLGFSYTMERV